MSETTIGKDDVYYRVVIERVDNNKDVVSIQVDGYGLLIEALDDIQSMANDKGWLEDTTDEDEDEDEDED